MIDISVVQKYLRDHSLSGWLLYDFQHINPVFWEVVGIDGHVTRSTLLLIPSKGPSTLLAHQVDAGRFADLGIDVIPYLGRADMQHHLGEILQVGQRLAMEYSPLGELPFVSRADAGTVELIKSLGVTIVSSADLIQYAVGRISQDQMALHVSAARKLHRIVQEAFGFIGQSLAKGVTEYEVCEFMRGRFAEENLVTDSGPATSVNQHSGDPHYEPSPATSARIKVGDWVLIDLWAKEQEDKSVYADITWVAFVGREVPATHQKAFEVVTTARDLAVRYLRESFENGEILEGRQVDECARNYIADRGYGAYFTHRLGHSLGRSVHSYAVNLDSFETWDTRPVAPGIAFTIEPGVYLPEFGMRSEINVVMTDKGPVVTTPVQEKVVLIHADSGAPHANPLPGGERE